MRDDAAVVRRLLDRGADPFALITIPRGYVLDTVVYHGECKVSIVQLAERRHKRRMLAEILRHSSTLACVGKGYDLPSVACAIRISCNADIVQIYTDLLPGLRISLNRITHELVKDILANRGDRVCACSIAVDFMSRLFMNGYRFVCAIEIPFYTSGCDNKLVVKLIRSLKSRILARNYVIHNMLAMTGRLPSGVRQIVISYAIDTKSLYQLDRILERCKRN